MIGRTLGHYLVRERLGSGGMGEVYLAEDKRLERNVALKLLPPELAQDAERRERFRREAKAVAALNHPNIVTIHSVEEAEGLLFLTLERVEGESLRERIDRGSLPPQELVAIGMQIAEGLARAHAAGILHRDLKPQNVMLTHDGRVKLLDFGLAKLLAPREALEDAVTRTREPDAGRMVGTAGYMAPEQALGRDVDARADLFSLGVVLYEMATGKNPFGGQTLAAVFDSLLHETPPSATTVNTTLPPSLALVLDKALQKDPERRYASARDLAEDLKAVAEARPVAARQRASIAVLPFDDLSPEKDQEYFCQGLADELINSLGALEGLRVVARTSAFSVHAQGLAVPEIGRRLQVDTVLEGSVRKAGSRLRVSTQLVDARDGYQIWSKRFERELLDVFAVQDEIALSVASELRLELGDAKERQSARHASGPEAHDFYLRGVHAMNRWTEASVDRAIACFEEALARDPGYALAHAALGECLVWFYSGIGTRQAPQTIPRAREAARKAVELAPKLAEGHKVLALIAMTHDWDRAAAERALLRAIDLSPGSADMRLWNGWRLALLEGNYAAALSELGVAEKLDPLDLKLKTQIAYIHYFVRDYERALRGIEAVLALDPMFAFGHYALGDVQLQRGRFTEAIAALEQSIRIGGSSANHLAILAYVHGLAGRADEARRLLLQIHERAAAGHASPIWEALAHLGLGERDAAFESLERAFSERDGSLVLVAASPEFDPLRSDPRFRSLLERMGLGPPPAKRSAILF